MLLQVPTQLTEDQLIGAVQALLDHHDALRLRLVVSCGKPRSLGPGGRAAGRNQGLSVRAQARCVET